MKLELKHIAPYLPYGLNLLEEFDINDDKVRILRGIELDFVVTDLERFPFNQRLNYYEIKPILHPLSEYCGQITAGDIMKKLNCNIKTVHQIWDLQSNEINIENMSVGAYNVMCKNHIDFNNLIENNLAIDINTIKN